MTKVKTSTVKGVKDSSLTYGNSPSGLGAKPRMARSSPHISEPAVRRAGTSPVRTNSGLKGTKPPRNSSMILAQSQSGTRNGIAPPKYADFIIAK